MAAPCLRALQESSAAEPSLSLRPTWDLEAAPVASEMVICNISSPFSLCNFVLWLGLLWRLSPASLKKINSFYVRLLTRSPRNQRSMLCCVLFVTASFFLLSFFLFLSSPSFLSNLRRTRSNMSSSKHRRFEERLLSFSIYQISFLYLRIHLFTKLIDR